VERIAQIDGREEAECDPGLRVEPRDRFCHFVSNTKNSGQRRRGENLSKEGEIQKEKKIDEEGTEGLAV
jgi:hypothetical protein